MPRPHLDRMSFLEHLEELRVRLVHSMIALCVTTALCWNWHEEIFHFLTQPLRRAFPDIKFIYTGPSEAFILYMKMSFFVGIFIAAPSWRRRSSPPPARPGPRSPSSSWRARSTP